jgi:hypothetical protein
MGIASLNPSYDFSDRRHCEQSEAIQTLAAATVWLASTLRASQ